ncbi:MAG: DUF2490 domain-containing protein [Bryobacterales bacterium]|nr:DUF2490 domain-containing protein [Bryobacterales bacterium]
MRGGVSPLLVLFALLYGAPLCPAQNSAVPFNKQLQWFSYSGDHPVKGRWGVHLEGGWRRMDDADWKQWFLRQGINYQLAPNVQISGGYSYFMTRPAGMRWDYASYPEHRLHEQITASHHLKRLPLRHRFRVEQRFLGSADFGDDDHRAWNRLYRGQYQIRSDIPLKRGRENRTVVSLGLYQEVFFRIRTPNAPIFEQNRLYAGLTYRPTRTLAFEGGAFSQRYQRIGSGMEHNVVVQFQLLSTLPLGRLFGR